MLRLYMRIWKRSSRQVVVFLLMLVGIFLAADVVGMAGETEYSEYAFFSEDQDEAKQIAGSLGARLIGWSHGVASISLNGGNRYGMEEFCMDSSIPKLYPELIYETCTLDENTEKFEQWHLEAVGAKTAWESSKGDKSLVAVIDTGINEEHGAFAGAIEAALSVVPDNAYGDDGIFSAEYKDTKDHVGHGTHVAGIIAARNYDEGCVGVAPECHVVSIKALERNGGAGYGKTSWIAAGVYEAIERGADVINMSFGGVNMEDAFLHEAIKKAREKGIVVVCAAGNIKTEVSKEIYPAAYDETIAVSGVKKTQEGYIFDRSYSNYGSFVDVSAPGTDIWSSEPEGYSNRSGTSMSCAVVSGAAAILSSVEPNIDPERVKTLLCGSASDLGEAGKDDLYGYGLLNMRSLIELYNSEMEALTPIPDIPDGSMIGAGCPVTVQADGKKVVYTINGDEPDQNSENLPEDGLIFPAETKEVFIKLRVLSDDGRLGPTVTLRYTFIPEVTILEDTGGKLVDEIIPQYGASKDFIWNMPCRIYSIDVPAKHSFCASVFSDMFWPYMGLFDRTENEASMLAQAVGVRSTDDGIQADLTWNNKSSEDVKVWMIVREREEREGSRLLPYTFSWENKKYESKKSGYKHEGGEDVHSGGNDRLEENLRPDRNAYMDESDSSVWYYTMEGVNKDINGLQEYKEGKETGQAEISEILSQKETEPITDALTPSVNNTKGNSKAEEKSLKYAFWQLGILCALCIFLFGIKKYIILIREKRNKQ